MAISTIEKVMIRITNATPESPIAVFRCNEPMKLDAVFANCVFTQRRIKNRSNFVGLFDGSMNPENTYTLLTMEILLPESAAELFNVGAHL